MDKYADIPLYIAHAILLYTSNHVLVTPNAQSYMKSDTVLFQKKKTYSTPKRKLCMYSTDTVFFLLHSMSDWLPRGACRYKGPTAFVLWRVLFYPIVLAPLLLHLDGNIHPWRSDLIGIFSGCLDRTVECNERQYVGRWKRPDSHRKVAGS